MTPRPTEPFALDGATLSIAVLEDVARRDLSVGVSPIARRRLEEARAVVEIGGARRPCRLRRYHGLRQLRRRVHPPGETRRAPAQPGPQPLGRSGPSAHRRRDPRADAVAGKRPCQGLFRHPAANARTGASGCSTMASIPWFRPRGRSAPAAISRRWPTWRWHWWARAAVSTRAPTSTPPRPFAPPASLP